MKTLGFFSALGLGTLCFGNLPDTPFIANEAIKGVDIVYELDNGKPATYKVEVGSIFSSGQILATGPGGLANLSNKDNRFGSSNWFQFNPSMEIQGRTSTD